MKSKKTDAEPQVRSSAWIEERERRVNEARKQMLWVRGRKNEALKMAREWRAEYARVKREYEAACSSISVLNNDGSDKLRINTA